MDEALAESGDKRTDLMTSSVSVLTAAEERTPGKPDFKIVLVSFLHHLLLSQQNQQCHEVFKKLKSIQTTAAESLNKERFTVTVFEPQHHQLFRGALSEAVGRHGPWYVSLVLYYNYVLVLYKKQTGAEIRLSSVAHILNFLRDVVKCLYQVYDSHRLTMEFLDHCYCTMALHTEIFSLTEDYTYLPRCRVVIQLIEQLTPLVTETVNLSDLTNTATEIINRTVSTIDDVEFKRLLLLTEQQLDTLCRYTRDPKNDSKWSCVGDLLLNVN